MDSDPFGDMEDAAADEEDEIQGEDDDSNIRKEIQNSDSRKEADMGSVCDEEVEGDDDAEEEFDSVVTEAPTQAANQVKLVLHRKKQAHSTKKKRSAKAAKVKVPSVLKKRKKVTCSSLDGGTSMEARSELDEL